MDINDFSGRPPLEAANAKFKRAIALDPSFAMAYLQAANSAPSFEEFRANLMRAVEHADQASEPERLLIQIAHRSFSGDMEGALQLAQQLTSRYPDNPRAWMRLANLQSGMGREVEARATAERAAQLSPEFVRPQNFLAISYMLRQPIDLAKSEYHVRRALELHPNEAAIYDLLGDLHRAKSEFPQAAEAYTRGLQFDSMDAGLYNQRGHVRTFSGNYAAARADYDSAAQRARGRASGGAAAYLNYRAFANLYERRDARIALAELEGVVRDVEELDPADPVTVRLFTLQNMAIIAIHHRLYPEAERAIERIAVDMRRQAAETGTEEFRRAREADIVFWRGALAARRGDYAAAAGFAREYMSLIEQERNPTKNRPAHGVLGLMAHYQNRHAEAVQHFDESDPNDTYFVYHRGLSLEALGRREEARAAFHHVATNNFNNVTVALLKRDAASRLQ